MGSALEIHELTKKYEGFTLDHISFQVPSGSIVGLIGENGAGKTSTINAVLGLIKKDSGEIEILGENADNLGSPIKEEIGVVFDGSNFSEELTPVKLNKVLRDVYSSWDQALFSKLLEQMEVPLSKKIKTFSKGMKMKLSIAVALAHHPRLLILDEATSDLEKVADYIVFIHKGKIIFAKSKDELLENYGIIKCGREQFEALDKEDQITYRRLDYEWQVLTADRNRTQKKYPKALVIPATIDEIMLLYVKGEHR